MKHWTILLLIILLPQLSYSQDLTKKSERLWWEVHEVAYNTFGGRNYKLYQTQDPSVFLRLHTGTGQIDQVQWSMDLDEEVIEPLNMDNLREGNRYAVDHNVFELFPTQNDYTFLLLNTENGELWHVQWSEIKEERFVTHINDDNNEEK